mmetsp:Transcript_11865/g.47857  ORF Transcript_11865/g.47857 Transcript_11865/m.47857 type:complete len:356 (+) Transcript_11865:3-1070(+)
MLGRPGVLAEPMEQSATPPVAGLFEQLAFRTRAGVCVLYARSLYPQGGDEDDEEDVEPAGARLLVSRGGSPSRRRCHERELEEAALRAAVRDTNVVRSNAGGFHSSDDAFACVATRRVRAAAEDAAHRLPRPAYRALRPVAAAGFLRDDGGGPRSSLGESSSSQTPPPPKTRRFRLLVDDDGRGVAVPSDPRSEAWFNVSGEGHYNRAHDHRGATWSGTYWIRVPATPPPPLHHSGAFLVDFEDDRPPGDDGEPPETTPATSYALIRPKPGVLVLFPPTLKHAVLPVAPWPTAPQREAARGDDDRGIKFEATTGGPPAERKSPRLRISLSFNVFLPDVEDSLLGDAGRDEAAAAV